MTRLKCRHCDWISEEYTDINTVIDQCKAHAKKAHPTQWKYWAWQGKVILEMFSVIS